jgi:hypothetical protein
VLAVLVLKPHYLVPILFVLTVRRCWSVLIPLLGTTAALLVLPTLSLGASATGAYLRVLLDMSTLEVPLSLSIVVGLLVNPHLLLYDQSLLPLPAVLLLRAARQQGRHAGIPLAGLYTTLTLLVPLQLVTPISPAPFVMVTLASLLVYYSQRSTRFVASGGDTAIVAATATVCSHHESATVA